MMSWWVLFVSMNFFVSFHYHCIWYVQESFGELPGLTRCNCFLFRIGNAVFLLMWIKEMIAQKDIDVFFFYDIACILHAHLKVS